MQLFFSHKSQEKPLVREIASLLPRHIQSWIDEDKLLLGDDIEGSLQSAIDAEVDFVVLLVGGQTFASPWVQKELAWAFGKEASLGRTILLPIVLDRAAWDESAPTPLKQRKFLECHGYTREDVKAVADQLSDALFALLSRLYRDSVKPRHIDDEARRNDVAAELIELRQRFRLALQRMTDEDRREYGRVWQILLFEGGTGTEFRDDSRDLLTKLRIASAKLRDVTLIPGLDELDQLLGELSRDERTDGPPNEMRWNDIRSVLERGYRSTDQLLSLWTGITHPISDE
jgi:hypothetical protein